MRIKNIEVDQKWNRGVLRLVFRSSDWLIDLVQSISSNEKALFWKPIKVRYFFRKDIPIQFPLIMQFINFGIRHRLYAVQEGINLSVRSQLAIFPIRTIFIGYDRTISVFVRLRSVFTNVMRTIVRIAAYDRSILTIVDLIVFMPFESFGFLISKFIIQGYRGRRWVRLCPVRHHQLDTSPRVWKNCINFVCIF